MGKHVEQVDDRLQVTVTVPESGRLMLIGSPGETIVIRQITGESTHAPLVVTVLGEVDLSRDDNEGGWRTCDDPPFWQTVSKADTCDVEASS